MLTYTEAHRYAHVEKKIQTTNFPIFLRMYTTIWCNVLHSDCVWGKHKWRILFFSILFFFFSFFFSLIILSVLWRTWTKVCTMYTSTLSRCRQQRGKKIVCLLSKWHTIHWQKEKMTQMITFYAKRMRANTNFFELKFFFANNLNKFVS